MSHFPVLSASNYNMMSCPSNIVFLFFILIYIFLLLIGPYKSALDFNCTFELSHFIFIHLIHLAQLVTLVHNVNSGLIFFWTKFSYLDFQRLQATEKKPVVISSATCLVWAYVETLRNSGNKLFRSHGELEGRSINECSGESGLKKKWNLKK